MRDAELLNKGSGNKNGEQCSESVSSLEFGHWIDMELEWGSGQGGRGVVEDNSRFLHQFLGGWWCCPLKKGNEGLRSRLERH